MKVRVVEFVYADYFIQLHTQRGLLISGDEDLVVYIQEGEIKICPRGTDVKELEEIEVADDFVAAVRTVYEMKTVLENL